MLCLGVGGGVKGGHRQQSPNENVVTSEGRDGFTSLNEKECSKSITCQTRQRLLSDCETPSEVGQWQGSEMGSLIAGEGYAPAHYRIFALVQD